MFSLISAWINGWVNNRKAGDLKRHRAHYDGTVMFAAFSLAGVWEDILSFTGSRVPIPKKETRSLCVLGKCWLRTLAAFVWSCMSQNWVELVQSKHNWTWWHVPSASIFLKRILLTYTLQRECSRRAFNASWETLDWYRTPFITSKVHWNLFFTAPFLNDEQCVN